MNHFWGRRLLTRDIKAIDCEEVNLPNYEKIAAVERLSNWILCHRCGMRTSVIDGQLADYGYFCTHCSYLGDATLNKIYICLISLKQNLEKSSFLDRTAY